MGCVATKTAFRFHCGVLKDKRTAGFGVALGTDCVLVSGGTNVVVAEGAVDVMAVAALDEAFFYLVMERLREGRLDVGVAGEAELRLRKL